MEPARTISLALLLAFTPVAAMAQRDDSVAIRNAIQRGVQYLKATQNLDGSWEYPGHELGITSLVALALVENGVPVKDSSIQNALQAVRGSAPSSQSTYDISLAILFLARVGDKTDTELVQELGARLAAGQLASGGWTYVCPLLPQGTRPASVSNTPKSRGGVAVRSGRLNAGRSRGMGGGDNSNTQFAVLGVWAAGRAGLDVSETMALVDRRFRTTQAASGGWGYTGVGDSDAMTCAGVMSLVLAKGQKVLDGQMANRKPDGDGARSRMSSDAHIERGLRRLGMYTESIGPQSTLYFLWSVERVGVALGLNRIGNVDWYQRGSAVLVDTQQVDGSWRTNRGSLADTSFALLFLHRSNLAEGMPRLVTGRSDGAETNMRAGSLEDLKRSVRPEVKADKE